MLATLGFFLFLLLVLQHVACHKIICESKTKWVVHRMTVGV